MKAGRELDAMVAEKVLGCEVRIDPELGALNPLCRCATRTHATVHGLLLPYSTSIEAAWQVVERMVQHHDYLLSDAEWDGVRSFAEFRLGSTHYGAFADKMPEAICKAALRACGVDVAEAAGEQAR